MRTPGTAEHALRKPALAAKAQKLGRYIQTLSSTQLAAIMHISPALAAKTHTTYRAWDAPDTIQSLAIDSFVGDIYSGLRASSLSVAERNYADQHLYILSGLYGVVRPYDTICPYRLEMGYRLPDTRYRDLYKFWGESIAACLPASGPIVNLAAVEYSKTVAPFVAPERLVTPTFLTLSPQTGEPVFVVVHAKIARGAFARWLITSQISDVSMLPAFNDIGYVYNSSLSTPDTPAFICQQFGGKGLSMRLSVS